MVREKNWPDLEEISYKFPVLIVLEKTHFQEKSQAEKKKKVRQSKVAEIYRERNLVTPTYHLLLPFRKSRIACWLFVPKTSFISTSMNYSHITTKVPGDISRERTSASSFISLDILCERLEQATVGPLWDGHPGNN